jgi:photosystem II stability/assembly factor-like uncharacterized protein
MKIRILPIVLLAAPTFAANPELLGPFGGSAAFVAVDTHRSGTVLAATGNALLFRSTNGGDTWERLPFPAELRARLHAFVVVPRSGVYLAGLGDDSRAYSGILRSADGGRSWTRLAGLGAKEVWSIAVWPLNSQVIAAGAADGVFLSRDGGEQWVRISPESNRALRPIVSLAFDTTDSRIVYAGTPRLPWRTTDGGQTWESAHYGMLDDSDIFSIHVDQTRPLRLFAAACSGMYHSVTQGYSWKKLPGADGAPSRTYQIVQDTLQPEIMFAGTARGLVRSTDRGVTWHLLSAHASRSVAFDPARPGRVYVATDDAGLFRSDDHGETLVSINEGFCNRRVLSLAASGDALWASSGASAAASTIYRRSLSGESWEDLGLRGPQVLEIVPLDATRLYALTPRNLLRSVDGGQTWEPFAAPPVSSRLTALLIPAVETPRLVVSTEKDGIYFSDDEGSTWLPSRAPEGLSGIKSLVALAPGSLAVVTPAGLMLSSDGAEFSAIPFPQPGSAIHGLVATGSGLMAATSRGLMRANAQGENWRRVPGVMDGSSVSAICKHPTRRGVLFASRYGRIYGSVDDGLTWIPVTPDGALQNVDALVTTEANPGAIFAVTRSHGVYLVPVEELLRAVENRKSPSGELPNSFVERAIQRYLSLYTGGNDTSAGVHVKDKPARRTSR